MFKYQVSYDEKTVRQMMPRAVKFIGRRFWFDKISGAVFIFGMILVLLALICDWMVPDGDESQIASWTHAGYAAVFVIAFLELIDLVIYRQKVLKKIEFAFTKESVLTFYRDQILWNEIPFSMDDVMDAEAYCNDDCIDLYMKLPAGVCKGMNFIGKHSCFWARLTPQNLICGNHRELIFFLKKRLGDRIRVSTTLS